ncbi:hypothetical protein ACFQAT_27655 [Undibacterium arcticum]|uniref:hypothetical protein n=1 Tax=Undibacterium arcticum TaxID=1762892 RepID=UPI003621F03B
MRGHAVHDYAHGMNALPKILEHSAPAEIVFQIPRNAVKAFHPSRSWRAGYGGALRSIKRAAHSASAISFKT